MCMNKLGHKLCHVYVFVFSESVVGYEIKSIKSKKFYFVAYISDKINITYTYIYTCIDNIKLAKRLKI